MARLHHFIGAVALAAASAVQAAPVTVSSVTVNGSATGLTSALTDGDFALIRLVSDPNHFVAWRGQEGVPGLSIVFELDQAYTLDDVRLSHGYEDLHLLQVSLNGVAWKTWGASFPQELDPGAAMHPGGFTGTIKRSSVLGEAGYTAAFDLVPAQARYVRLLTVAGDGLYAVGEVQFEGIPAVNESSTLALALGGLLTVGGLARRRKLRAA